MPKTNAATAPADNTAAKEPSRRSQWRAQSMVTLTEKGQSNPKKAGTASFERYQNGYLNPANKSAIKPGGKGVSVETLFSQGIRMDDIRHDVEHGHIALSQPFDLREEKPAEVGA